MGPRATAWTWVKKTANRVLPRDRFAQSVAVLAGGTALGQIIIALASPILTRLYTPEDFGVLAVYSSMLGILSVVASMRYELAIPLPEKDEDAAALLVLSLGIVVLMSLLTGLGVWRLGGQIVHWANAPAFKPYLWLLPVGVGMVGAYQVFNYWAVRKQAFGQIARTKLYQGLGAVLTQVGLGCMKLGPVGLLLGQVIGQAAGISVLLRFASTTASCRNRGTAARSDVKDVAIRYQRFPKLSTLPAVINSIGLQMTIITVAALHGPETTGWFSLAQKVLAAPLMLIGAATAQVTLGQAAEYRRFEKRMERLFWKVIRQQSFLGIPFLILAPLLPYGFPLIFGSGWAEAGVYGAIWMPALIANFIASPTGGFLDVLERQEVFLLRELCRLTILGSTVALCVFLHLDAFQTIVALAGATTLFAFFYAAFSWGVIRRSHKGNKYDYTETTHSI